MNKHTTISDRPGRWQVVSESPNKIRLRRIPESGIARIRYELGIAKQCDFAKIIGCARCVVSEVENGRRTKLPAHAAQELRKIIKVAMLNHLLKEVQ